MYTEARLGQLWQVLTPLLNAGVYYLIFGLLLGTNRGVPDYISFLVTGVFVFNFTQRAFITSSQVIRDTLPLIRALYFPRACLPLGYVLIELQQLVLCFAVLFIIVVIAGEPVTPYWLFIIPVLILQSIFNVGCGFILARWGASFDDVSQLLPFIVRTWMYTSGVLFSLQTLTLTLRGKLHDHPTLAYLLQINPAAVYITLIRWALLAEYRDALPGAKPYNHAKCLLYRTFPATRNTRATARTAIRARCPASPACGSGPPPGRWWWSSSASCSSGARRRGTAVAEDRPMVVVDDLHVVYRVYGGNADKGTAATALLRLIKRQRRPSIREVHAIRGISFVAYRGDAVGVIGRNGSGKSTLLRAIAGLLPAEQGMVYTDGHGALLGVNAALLDDLTGERNVVLGCLAMGMTTQETKEAKPRIVDFSGVGDFINLPMKAYSTGMGSRLRFAIASAKSHDILLVDEALATGDAEFQRKSHDRIDELRQQAGTVFLVAHQLSEIFETCNRIIWLEKGQIVKAGNDVPGILDDYLVASGGEPRFREGAATAN